MNQVIDSSTLTWVKKELDETLKEARQALESHVDDAQQTGHLDTLANRLHQVYGTLQMVELYGAALLAEEMEQTSRAMLAGSVAQRDDACEVLMRAILQLPDYLDRLVAGYRDIPLVLLPLLNDLRAVRGAGLLSENTMFSPDLGSPLPASVQNVAAEPDMMSKVRELRHRFQRGLLGWLRDKNPHNAQQILRETVESLFALGGHPTTVRLWWVCAGMLDALIDGGMEGNVALKRILGQVDREIKRLIDEGEAALIETPHEELLKNLLFYCAQVSPSVSPRIAEIQETYRLRELLPDESEISSARESLSGRNSDLYETVAVALKEELARLKDNLDIVLRNGCSDTEGIPSLMDALQRLSDTLGMLGLGAARKAVLEKAADLRDCLETDAAAADTALMDVASTLLLVESSVDAMGTARAPSSADKPAAEQLAESEYNQVMEVAIKEAIADLVRAKDAIIGYTESDHDISLIGEVPQWFNQVKGGMLLLGEERPAALVSAITRYISIELIEGGKRASQDELDALADAVCGLEYFLESRQEQKLYGGPAMDVAEQGIEKLGYASQQPIPEPADSEPQAPVDETPAVAADEAVSHQPLVEENPADSSEMVMATAEPAPPEPVANEPLNWEEIGDSSAETAMDEVTAANDNESELAVIGADVDEEILEIFIEEAEEELASISAQLPVWLANSDDADALAMMRRSWHTLKGSGRLVGAMRIGEFAWAFENMLNRVIDGSVAVTPALQALLQSAATALPVLVAQIKDGSPVGQPIEPLMRHADAISRGEVFDADAVQPEIAFVDPASETTDGMMMPAQVDDWATPPATAEITVSEVAASDVSENEEDSQTVYSDAVMDPLLYDIFNTESHAHLEVIRQCLARVTAGDSQVDEPLVRALHTLHGSAHMADSDEIAQLAGGMEKLLKTLMVNKLPMPAEVCTLLDDTIRIIESTLSRLPLEKVVPQDFGDVMQKVAAEFATASANGALRTGSTNAEHAPDDEVVAETPETVFAPDSGDDMSPLAEPEPFEQPLPQPALAQAVDLVAEPADPYAGHDDELLQVFLEEAAENLESADGALQSWRESQGDSAALAALQRALHTLKGGARMADLPAIGDVAHAVESLLSAMDGAGAAAGVEYIEGVQQAHDCLAQMLDQVRARQVLQPAAELVNRLEALREAVPAAADAADLVEEVPADSVDRGGDDAQADPYVEVDPELLGVFIEEAGDIVGHCEQTLQNWKRARDDQELIAELQRELHTLKGGARMADITEIGDLAHAVESLMVRVADGAVAASDSLFMVLESTQDRLADMVDKVSNRAALEAASDIIAKLDKLRAGQEVEEKPVAQKAPGAKSSEAVALAADNEFAERRSRSRSSQELIRVKAELLDNMVNYAGEVSIYRSRLEQQIGAYGFNLVEMEQTVARVREQLRKLEIETEAQVLYRYEREGEIMDEGSAGEDFDPLEMDRYSHMQQLSRSLMESVSDLSSIQNMLENITRESETLLLQQSRVNTELQEGLMRTRIVPFLGLAARMRRIVRQTAQELNKKAELELSGAEGEMDRTVVDRIVAPLEHMLRNAISHGIETPAQRRASGKPESGTIRITLERESSDVVLRIADDGAGINLDAIRRKAIQRGMMETNSELTDNEVLQFILETGFSTAEQVTQVAGRGVGMDVVNSEVKQLGGSLHIDSIQGKGTTFTVRLPFTLALNQALLVEVGDDTYAIPLSSIEGIVRMRREDLRAHYDDPDTRFAYGQYEYEVRHLGSVLVTGIPHLDSGPKRLPVLLARFGEHCVAFHVENLLGSREIVVKSVGPQISTVPGVSGATILGDGRVVMILDVAALLRGGAASMSDQVNHLGGRPAARGQGMTVMVVDDSITVRKVTTRILERNDMNVIAAKDGVDAVSKLQDHIPDIMLLDIEMPRMDGFELATHVRNEARLRNIPIIMITSRTGDKHRQRAMQIGVNRYLGKPFQESELLENIQALLEETGSNG